MDLFDLIERDHRPDRYQYLLLDEETQAVARKDGYPVERFTSPPSEDYICIVCIGVVRDPLECQNCGLLLCSKCVSSYLESRRQRGGMLGLRADFSCPTCRHKAEPRRPSRVLTDIIAELEVFCKNRAEGCGEVRKLRDVKLHQKACVCRATRCVYCNAQGSKEEFLQSESEGKRIYACSIACQRTYEFQHLLRTKKREDAVKLYFSLLQEAEQ